MNVTIKQKYVYACEMFDWLWGLVNGYAKKALKLNKEFNEIIKLKDNEISVYKQQINHNKEDFDKYRSQYSNQLNQYKQEMLNINQNITHYKTFENEMELRIKEINDLKKRNSILQQKIKNIILINMKLK